MSAGLIRGDTRRRVGRLVAALMLIGSLCAGQLAWGAKPESAETSKPALLDQLPALWPALAERKQLQAKATMMRYLLVYLRDEYEIVDQRFFQTDPGFSKWVLLSKRVGTRVENDMAGVMQHQDWQEMGIDLVAIWRLGPQSGRYIAVVMTDGYQPGMDDPAIRKAPHLVGYFELTKP